MKPYQIAMLFFLAVADASCSKKSEYKPPSVQVTALVDITDRRDVLPDAETLLLFYDFTKEKNTEAFFRLTTTTDKLLNPVAENHLASGDETEKDNQFDDPDFREKLVLSFYSDVRKSISAFNKTARQDSSIGNSEVFRSITNELVRMKESKTSKNLLAIYSDLGENSDLFNIYRKAALEQLLKHPDTVLQKFQMTKLLPKDLSGFTLLFIFQPRSKDQDKMFNAMEAIYKTMLTARGAKVVVSADNPKCLQL